MEQGPKAVAALVSESIGGLQLEIALACHVRFASVGTICLDFPWLKYGLMPILGGTQRLPRLCGIEWAARLLLEAEKMSRPGRGCRWDCLVIKDHSLPEAAAGVGRGESKARATLGPGSSRAFCNLFSKAVESPTPRKDLSQAPAPLHS